jgi:anti-sigma factor RsiW
MGMDCRKIEQLLSPFLDGELAPGEAGAVRSHLSACADCQQEYEGLLQLSVAFTHMIKALIPAPSGFKDSVLGLINEEKVVTPLKTSHWYNKNWKQLVAGAAAAVLLIFGVVSMNAGPMVQLADKTPIVESQPGASNPGVVTPTSNSIPTQSGAVPSVQSDGITPAVKEDGASSLVAVADPAANSLRSDPVFLNKERSIITTMLKVKVVDSSSALEQALKIAGDMQAQTQNLGQQVNENGSYTALKITVAKSAANSLISELSSLGTVSSQEVDKTDISTQYSETLSQYQILVTQRATLEDVSQKAQLDQRIEALQNELQDWEQKAEQETIVLWLEK